MVTKRVLNIVDIENGLESLSGQNLSTDDYGKQLVLLFSSANTLKRIVSGKTNTPEFEGGILWREKFHYAPCSPENLTSTLEALKQSPKTIKAKVRLLVVSDGTHILVFDRKFDELTECTVQNIKDEPQLFLPLTGQERFRTQQESEVDIKATGKLAKFYDALVEHNSDWLEGKKRHSLNHFMTQIIFCFFAEDTGIFAKDIFSRTLQERGGSNGELLSSVISQIFSTFDLPDNKRQDIPTWLNSFPYVNGGLFAGEAEIPEFTAKAFRYLNEAASLDWKHINPDILGSSIQAIVDPKMRGNLGMHYTSVPNILKTLDPLFLDDLRTELFNSRNNKKKLDAFLGRLSSIVVMDPACGSGNFLVIAYRELRKLELQAMDALRDLNQGASMAFGFSSVVSLSNFYGIELADFAAETAKLALWIAEYQQNARFVAAFGADIPALPLRESGYILCSNALRVDWEQFCNVTECREVYLVGNPPYLGSSLMDSGQKDDMKLVFSDKTKSFKSLDYVCAWFLKATELCKGRNAQYAFVATNSISQGAHVPSLWPLLFELSLEISFAHTSFKWRNNAAQNAAVICVIIGMRNHSAGKKFLFNEGESKEVSNINGYLIEASNVEVKASKGSISNLPSMDYGNKPADGGNLILSEQEALELINTEPDSARFIRKYVGAQELIKGLVRHCLWVERIDYEQALNISGIAVRAERVKSMRLDSTKKQTREQAAYPLSFGEARQHDSSTVLLIPRHSSENRDYLPVGVLTSNEIVSDSAFAIYDGSLHAFAILVSKLHICWIGSVCGKIKSDFRYSNTLGWHTFPVPQLGGDQIEALNQSARKIILTRENHYPKSIAELYDREKMPDDLRQAHEENDVLLESFYREASFTDDNDRLTHLFERYVEMTKGN
ncbi:class I SAM-dependent DNA methyltransferase [Shewanella japonica]|uniref:class I SAM-dependent DNA methyltransferase n=1 Tax=Shewanella japonica TaxID=93973 RepID=UPI002494FB6F|nr:DNA methyltransferase [Shewanella japonica]